MATGRLPDPNSSPLTAKGDLYTYSTVPAKLAVGNNGETLVADSSATTGLRWQAVNGINAIIGGGMDIWQRGTSAVTLSAAAFNYTADRWFVARSAGTSGVTATQATSIGLDGFRYALRIQRTNGDTSTGTNYVMTNLETANSIPFANKTVTVSFWARAGANYSAASGALLVTLRSGTGTDQSGYTSGWTGSANVLQQTATLTTSWQRFSYSGTVASTATQLGLQFDSTPVGTAGANDWFDITGVQLELGSVATPFKRAGGTLAGELAACQRYFANVVPSTADYGTVISMFQATSSTTAKGGIRFPVPMRTSASITLANANNFTLANASYTPIGGSSFTYAIGNTVDCRIDMSVASGLVAGNATALSGQSSSILIQASAEL